MQYIDGKPVLYHPLRTNVRLAGSVIRAESCLPPPDLAPYLIEFYQYEVPESVPYAPVQIYPSGVAVLRFDILADDVVASLFGPSLSPHMRGLFFRGIPIFGVAIQATRAYHILGLSVSELRDLRIQLDVLWPNTIRTLKERLWGAESFAQRAAIASEFLRDVLRPRAPEPEFLRAFEALVASDGAASLRQACAREVSTRTLRRHFAQYVGLSPKQTARVIRFQRLLACLTQRPNVRLAQIAQHTGYSDQAHMIHDFVQLVGIPPGRYLSYLSRLHDPQLEIWSRLDPQRAAQPWSMVRRLDRPARAAR